MRRVLLSMTAALFLIPLPLLAQDRADIPDVIRGQIAAFEASDVTTAFGFASPTIRGMFGSAERFGRMVETGYPMVWRPAEVQFLDQREEFGLLVQRVLIQDAAGALHVLEYQMVPSGESWLVNGVRFAPTGAGV